MMTGEFVLPEVIVGMIEASTTRNPESPWTRSWASTTAKGSSPMRHVPTGWKMVVAISPAFRAKSISLWKAGPGRNSSGVERMKRFAQPVSRQWLHVIFEVGGGAPRIGLGEDAELAGSHRQRAAAADGVLQPHPCAADEVVVARVERPRVADPKDRPDLQMVLEVLAYPVEPVSDGDPKVPEYVRTPDPRELEQLRRIDSSRRQTDFPSRHCLDCAAPVANLHTGDLRAVEDQPLGFRARENPQVLALLHRAEKRLGGVPAHAAALVDLEIPRPKIIAAIEIGYRWDAEFHGGALKGIEDGPAQPLPFHPPLTPCAMEITIACVVIFRLAEEGQHIVPAPAGIA